MIARIRGQIIDETLDTLVIDVRGIGYELMCSSSTIESVAGKDVVQLWVPTHVRDDQISLFGFGNPKEKQLFLSLIKVNGIGPKMASQILSAAPYNKLLTMIENGDVKALVSLPKIGKKKAEQIVLSLKGQLVFADESTNKLQFIARTDIVSALVNLGFKITDVEKAVDQMPTETDLQAGVRQGLAALTAGL